MKRIATLVAAVVVALSSPAIAFASPATTTGHTPAASVAIPTARTPEVYATQGNPGYSDGRSRPPSMFIEQGSVKWARITWKTWGKTAISRRAKEQDCGQTCTSWVRVTLKFYSLGRHKIKNLGGGWIYIKFYRWLKVTYAGGNPIWYTFGTGSGTRKPVWYQPSCSVHGGPCAPTLNPPGILPGVQLDAYTTSARPACGNIFQGDIVLQSWRLSATKRKADGKRYAAGKLTFYVNAAPLEGGFDLRLQVWDEAEVNWVSKDVVKKDVGDGNVTPCQTFYMSVKHVCGGKLSWRLRLFVAPGTAHDGTKTGPELHYYPKPPPRSKGGKQLNCR